MKHILDKMERTKVSSSKVMGSDKKVKTCLIRATSVWAGS
jgi:hypothetical protein